MLRSLTGLTAAISLLAGCASAPVRVVPAYLRAADAEPPRYPRSQFVSAVGTSTLGASDADQRALSGVAQQISASIQVEVGAWASSTGTTDSAKYLEKIALSSSFAHAELMRVVERTDSDGVFYSLAVLERAEAEAALARDLAPAETRFAAAADRAHEARAARRSGEFAAAAAEAQAALPAVEAAYLVRHALLKAASATERAHVQRRNALIAALVDSRSRRVVGVRLDGAASGTLLKLAVGAVKRLGLRVAEGKSCEAEPQDSQADATELVLSAQETCGDGSFGPKCEVNVRLHARGCAGGGEGEGRIAKAGASTDDRAHALAKAWENVTDQLVDSAVREALRGTLSAESDR